MMWAALAGFAATTVAAVWLLTRWADRRFDHHTESALALAAARDRHPVSRPRCRCGRFVLGAGVQAYRAHDHGEQFHHSQDCCQPAREAL